MLCGGGIGSGAMTKGEERGENKPAPHDLHIFLYRNGKAEMLQIPNI